MMNTPKNASAIRSLLFWKMITGIVVFMPLHNSKERKKKQRKD
jgi:hypothetical protein